jgi:pimeloyl-ACP methyl ester carboxylesterase
MRHWGIATDMFRFLAALIIAWPALAATPAEEAAYGATFSAAALGQPLPGPSAATGFTMHYRGAMPHAAFAIAQDADGRGAWGMSSGRPTPDSAREAALTLCRDSAQNARGGALQAPCRLVALDGLVEGRPPLRLETATLGPFRRSPLHLYRGPAAAQGVVVWGHGYEGADRDIRDAPLPGFLSALNNAGFDIYRFDRHPGDDALHHALPTLLAGLPALRGYARVILGGQSRGGWQALAAAAQAPALVDGVIATAPAAHGQVAGESRPALALDDFRRQLAGLSVERVRMLIAVFDQDEFDPGPAARAALVAELAATRGAPMLAIWPQAPIRGHSGAYDWRFTRDFAACALTLFQAPPAAAPRGLRREGCGGG